MILVDTSIRDMSLGGYWNPGDKDKGVPVKYLIDPFSEPISGQGVISYGLTSSGYDLRLHNELVVFKTIGHRSVEPVDPKRFNEPDYFDRVAERVTVEQDIYGHRGFVIPPHGYILGRSVEYIKMPKMFRGTCTGKSTYARCGIAVNTTPLEPGWEGYLVIEIANCLDLPVNIHIYEGIAQLEFHQLERQPESDYAAKGGKYQGQTGVTLARVIH
jgi:dCTP deaminase